MNRLIRAGGARGDDVIETPAAVRLFRTLILACALTASAACIAHASEDAGEDDKLPPTAALQRDVMVPMRDGIRLATDIYLPARDGVAVPGRYPVILRRTPYGKGWSGLGTYYTAHGYAVVQQDTRGRHASEGVWRMLADDGRSRG